MSAALDALVRRVPDYPHDGILFYDVMPLFQDHGAFRQCVDALAESARDQAPECVVGVEARGFIIGAALAQALGVGFVAARKPGKLPWDSVSEEYQLEYGTDRLEMHTDGIAPGQRALICDDLLATGGTASAVVRLVESLGGVVAGIAVMVELTFLPGREALAPHPVRSLLTYDNEAMPA